MKKVVVMPERENEYQEYVLCNGEVWINKKTDVPKISTQDYLIPYRI
jgi:hypothetical protein